MLVKEIEIDSQRAKVNKEELQELKEKSLNAELILE